MKASRQEARDWRGRLSNLNPLATGLGPAGRLLRLMALALVLYLAVTPWVMLYEYGRAFPPFFDPAPATAEGAPPPPRGSAYAGALIAMSERMLAAWLPNDVVWPSIFLDNPQNFQLGQLEVVRYATRVLRDKLSRQRTTDKIDAQADLAYTAFSNNPHVWLFPSAEQKFAGGVEALKNYRQGLTAGTGHFHPRADNLIELLEQLASLLGGVDTRLANAPRDRRARLSEETAGDRYTQGETQASVTVPWSQIDDNFYYARGVAYGIRVVLAAARWEFNEVLKLKRSHELMDNLIDDLGLADFEPLVVLNGGRGSIFANHSLSLLATLENARQKMISLQAMLER